MSSFRPCCSFAGGCGDCNCGESISEQPSSKRPQCEKAEKHYPRRGNPQCESNADCRPKAFSTHLIITHGRLRRRRTTAPRSFACECNPCHFRCALAPSAKGRPIARWVPDMVRSAPEPSNHAKASQEGVAPGFAIGQLRAAADRWNDPPPLVTTHRLKAGHDRINISKNCAHSAWLVLFTINRETEM